MRNKILKNYVVILKSLTTYKLQDPFPLQKKKKKKGSLHWLLTFLLLPALTEENPEKRSQPYKVLYAKTCLDTSIDLKKKQNQQQQQHRGRES